MRGIAGKTPDFSHSMLPGSSPEPHEPSAESSSALSALDDRANELRNANLKDRKGALAEGQDVSEVREAVKDYFFIKTKAEEFKLIQQMEKERGVQKEGECPATLNEIKDYESHIQDGRGGGRPLNSTSFSRRKGGIKDPPVE